jgi:hypothetical protein
MRSTLPPRPAVNSRRKLSGQLDGIPADRKLSGFVSEGQGEDRDFLFKVHCRRRRTLTIGVSETFDRCAGRKCRCSDLRAGEAYLLSAKGAKDNSQGWSAKRVAPG